MAKPRTRRWSRPWTPPASWALATCASPPSRRRRRLDAVASPLMAADKLLNAWYTGHPALRLLWPLECLYRAVVQRKRQRFLAGEGDIYRAPVPVVVVGNITVGGTGKTPMILSLIAHCQARGLKVGVVSRGYGATPPQLPWRVRAE